MDVDVKESFLDYHCKFYHPTKKRNQYSICQSRYVEVDRASQQSIPDDEQEKHELVWMNIDEFLQVSTHDTTVYLAHKRL